MTQQQLRNMLKNVMLDELDYLQMFKLAEALDGEQVADSKGVTLAIRDATDALDSALRKIGRLAVRLGYIQADTLDKPARNR